MQILDYGSNERNINLKIAKIFNMHVWVIGIQYPMVLDGRDANNNVIMKLDLRRALISFFILNFIFNLTRKITIYRISKYLNFSTFIDSILS